MVNQRVVAWVGASWVVLPRGWRSVLAVGAIGKNLMGGHTPAAPAAATDNFANHDLQSLQSNPDMGGQNFGVNDTSSWDEGGSADAGGGVDWDN